MVWLSLVKDGSACRAKEIVFAGFVISTSRRFLFLFVVRTFSWFVDGSCFGSLVFCGNDALGNFGDICVLGWFGPGRFTCLFGVFGDTVLSILVISSLWCERNACVFCVIACLGFQRNAWLGG